MIRYWRHHCMVILFERIMFFTGCGLADISADTSLISTITTQLKEGLFIFHLTPEQQNSNIIV